MMTFTFSVTGMRCAGCGLLLDETLEDEVPGVESSQTSVRKGQTVVVAAAGVTADSITKAIADAGYQAQLRESA